MGDFIFVIRSAASFGCSCLLDVHTHTYVNIHKETTVHDRSRATTPGVYAPAAVSTALLLERFAIVFRTRHASSNERHAAA